VETEAKKEDGHANNATVSKAAAGGGAVVVDAKKGGFHDTAVLLGLVVLW
jgi:hypothetical protein